MALIDNFTEEQLRKIVEESSNYTEVLRKIGYTVFGGRNHNTLKARLEKYQISVEHFTTKPPTQRTEDNVFCINSTAAQATLRRWFIKGNYVPYKCSICGIVEWQDKELKLQLDHINGDNHDNRLENLRWLCPNCHSQTDTFCGKQKPKVHITSNDLVQGKQHNYCVDCGKEITITANRCEKCARTARRVVERPSKEELFNFLKENKGNFSLAGRIFGVSDNAVRKWCKQYELPFRSGDY